MNSRQYSLFPAFPWMGFMLFGGFFASGYIGAREADTENRYTLRFAFGGAVVFVLCAIARELPWNLRIGPQDARANPVFFFERLGIVMLLLTACWLYVFYRKTEKTFVLDVSRESLMVYAAHLLVIYGQFWHERSLAFYYGGSFDVLECIAGTVFLLVVMSAAAMLWGRLKRNHLPLARVYFWIFSGAVTIYYFTH